MLIPKAAAACTAGILFPFYIYPSKTISCDQWQTMISTLNAHPSLPITLVINPGTGPGGTLPDSEYQACLPTLRQTSNSLVKLVGYVSTNYTNRAASDVNGDVSTYANWPAAYRPDGIFFDEVSADAGSASTYNGYISNAQSLSWHSSSAYTILNPGTAVPDAYFEEADLVITEEVHYDDFNNDELNLTDSNEPPSKQAVVLINGPSTLPTSTVDQLITTDQLNSIFITDVTEADNAYGSYPSYWTDFVSAVASAAGGC